MNIERILGRREDQRLEFKSADVLASDLESVARAVAGMLNAEGGEIWIGVEEENERPAAINPAAEPERARRRLEDYLVELIEPAPQAGEVTIEMLPVQADRAILVVRIQPPERSTGRWPFAFRKKGGWHFVRRIGARNHPMTRDEIFAPPVMRSADKAVENAIQRLLGARQEFRDSAEEGLWLALAPARKLELDLQNPLFDRLANDPVASGNRRSGWHFARSTRAAKLGRSRLRWGLLGQEVSDSDLTWVEVRETGELRFWLALRGLLHQKGEDQEIWPLILLEYPISAFRIAREVYRGHLVAEDLVAANLALFQVNDWKLRRGTPGEIYFYDRDELRTQSETDLIWEPETLKFRDIDEAPDRCGFRWVRRVYQAFGLPETAIPRQYDRETGKLLLSE